MIYSVYLVRAFLEDAIVKFIFQFALKDIMFEMREWKFASEYLSSVWFDFWEYFLYVLGSLI